MAAAAVMLASSSPLALTDVPRARPTAVPAEFFAAAADGRAAVVLARGPTDHGAAFSRRGIATLVVDPYAARPARRTSEATMLADAFAALAFLAATTGVDRHRITLVGLGACGAAALLANYAQLARLFAPGGARFGAHVSFDGAVAARLEDYRTTGAVVAVIGGQGDRGEQTRRGLVIGDLREGGSPVEELSFGTTPPGPGRRRLARDVRITPDNVMLDDRSGRPVGPLIARLRLATGALAGPQRLGSSSAEMRADAVLMRYVSWQPMSGINSPVR